MNIFSIPVSLYYDAHMKMALETAQLLYSVWHHAVGLGLATIIPHPPTAEAYRNTHKNHPSAVWARCSPMHYVWLCQLGLEICAEYSFRFGKEHACKAHITALLEAGFPPLPENELYISVPPAPTSKTQKPITPAYHDLPASGMQWFALAITDDQYHVPAGQPSAVESYMRYFISKKDTMKKRPTNKRVEKLMSEGHKKEEIVSHLLALPTAVNMPARLHDLAGEIVQASMDAATPAKSGAKLVLKKKKKKAMPAGYIEPLMPPKKKRKKRAKPAAPRKRKEKEWWQTATWKRMCLPIKEKKALERKRKKARRNNPKSDSYKLAHWKPGVTKEPNWKAMSKRVKARYDTELPFSYDY